MPLLTARHPSASATTVAPSVHLFPSFPSGSHFSQSPVFFFLHSNFSFMPFHLLSHLSILYYSFFLLPNFSFRFSLVLLLPLLILPFLCHRVQFPPLFQVRLPLASHLQFPSDTEFIFPSAFLLRVGFLFFSLPAFFFPASFSHLLVSHSYRLSVPPRSMVLSFFMPLSFFLSPSIFSFPPASSFYWPIYSRSPDTFLSVTGRTGRTNDTSLFHMCFFTLMLNILSTSSSSTFFRFLSPLSSFLP